MSLADHEIVLPKFGKHKALIGLVIAGIVLAILGTVFIPMTFVQIQAGFRGVLLNWGDADLSQPPLQSGLHTLLPVMQVIIPVNTQVQIANADASAASKDLQVVSTKVALNYHLNPEKVNTFYKGVGLDYVEKVIAPTIQEVVKQVTANYNAEELITKRPLVKAEIEDALKVRLIKYDIIVDQVSITDFNFSPEFNTAIESKVTAQQNALAEENKVKINEAQAQQAVAIATGQANSAIAVANGQKQSAILAAEGEAQATVLRATAEANAIKLKGQGQAEAIKNITQYLKDHPEYIELMRSQAWDGHMPTTLMSSSGSVPLYNLNPPK
jgi:prohibitin 2